MSGRACTDRIAPVLQRKTNPLEKKEASATQFWIDCVEINKRIKF